MALDPMLNAVRDFHTATGLTVGATPAIRDRELRLALIAEEGAETAESLRGGSLPGAVDGIADTLYVVYGTAVSYGIDLPWAPRVAPASAPTLPEPRVAQRLAREWEGEIESTLAALRGEDLGAIETALRTLIRHAHRLAARLGVPADLAFAEVHRSNMTKRGGAIREDGKRLKPANYIPPDLHGMLVRLGWTPEEPV